MITDTRIRSLLIVLPLAAACPKAPSLTDTDTDGEATDTTGTSEPTTSTTDIPTATSDQPTQPDTTTTGPAPDCPDGELDVGEVCDDGNAAHMDETGLRSAFSV